MGEVEVVEYKYLSVHMDNRLDWRCNIDAVYKKGQSRLYLFRKLWSFSVCSEMLHYLWRVQSHLMGEHHQSQRN